jgi:hypothetical protein
MEIELLLQQIISNKLQCLKKTVDKQSEKKVHFITIYKDSNFGWTKWTKKSRNNPYWLSNNAYYVSIDSKYYGQSKVSKTLEHQ